MPSDSLLNGLYLDPKDWCKIRENCQLVFLLWTAYFTLIKVLLSFYIYTTTSWLHHSQQSVNHWVEMQQKTSSAQLLCAREDAHCCHHHHHRRRASRICRTLLRRTPRHVAHPPPHPTRHAAATVLTLAQIVIEVKLIALYQEKVMLHPLMKKGSSKRLP